MTKFQDLTENQRKKVDRALKHAEQAADYLDLSLESICQLFLERTLTRKRGGTRQGAGRPATDWKAATGTNLSTLPLRLVIQKALHETRSNEPLTDEEAFGLLLDPDTSAGDRKARYRAMQKALRKIPRAEQERHARDRKERRKRRQLDANQTSD